MAQPYTLPICKKFNTDWGLGAVDLEKQSGWAKKLKMGVREKALKLKI
jgi:hypothetical protein